MLRVHIIDICFYSSFECPWSRMALMKHIFVFSTFVVSVHLAGDFSAKGDMIFFSKIITENSHKTLVILWFLIVSF